MNTRFALSVLTASFFVGCASQSGSHPKAAQVSSCSVVPTVADPRHIEVNGRAMTSEEFLTLYCAGQSDSHTCVTVIETLASDGPTHGRE